MVEEIQEKLQEFYNDIQIDVEYLDIRKYKIILLKKVQKDNIIKKSVSFEYRWSNDWSFYSNIEQIKYSINRFFKLYLEREVNDENN